MTSQDYLQRQRHVLLDMHIPDWNGRFLEKFDPAAYVELCTSAGADAVMVYCNSHVGLCYWPTRSGKMHDGLSGRDIVRKQVELLHAEGISVCAYYSGPVFNNWAYTEHPEWRVVSAFPRGMSSPGSRYGLVCPNNSDSLDFVLRQLSELADYPFDGFFFDMVFWPGVCVCDSCRERLRTEEGMSIPEAVDWFDEDWCRFQAARERWLADALAQMRGQVKGVRDIPVFINGGIASGDWKLGVSDALISLSDLIGGDLNDAALRRSWFPLVVNSTPTVAQYMKAVAQYGTSSVHLMSTEEQLMHAFTATAFGAQFMAIDAVEPDGTVNSITYERLRDVFSAIAPYSRYLGTKPHFDIAVYCSISSNVDFLENGTSLDINVKPELRPLPHAAAMRGAVSALTESHFPVGVVTRRDLDKLADVPVLVLPNALRLDAEEVDAIRQYVDQGGRLYASGYSSLVATNGTRHEDFLLADVFGCHYDGEWGKALTYLEPTDDAASSWISPARLIAHGEPDVNSESFNRPVTALRITTDPGVRTVARTVLPYGTGRGTRDDREWASIHNSPPWAPTDRSAIVRQSFGAGDVIYSTVDLEAAANEPSTARSLFVGLVASLLPRKPRFRADAHRNAWITVFDHVDNRQLRVCILNQSQTLPALPIPRTTVHLTPPTGAVTGLSLLPDGSPVPYTVHDDGGITFEVRNLEQFAMLAATYEPSHR